MEKLIVITDLGCVRVLRVNDPSDDPQVKPHLSEVPGSPAQMRTPALSQVVTDQAGRFPQSGPTDRLAGMSYGEEHHLEDELQTQAIQRVAGKIEELVGGAPNCPPWMLIAPGEILSKLRERLPRPMQDSLCRTEPADLTGFPVAALERRLLAAPAKAAR
jgi:hypothetical protein